MSMFFFLLLCQKTILEDRAKELERTRDRERELWQQKMNQKEQELLKTRSQMFSQLEDYENLLDVKLALDMEINAYRKMLEVEEQRCGTRLIKDQAVWFWVSKKKKNKLKKHLDFCPSGCSCLPVPRGKPLSRGHTNTAATKSEARNENTRDRLAAHQPVRPPVDPLSTAQ